MLTHARTHKHEKQHHALTQSGITALTEFSGPCQERGAMDRRGNRRMQSRGDSETSPRMTG